MFTSLLDEVEIVVMVNLVQWMLYQIGHIRQAPVLSQGAMGTQGESGRDHEGKGIRTGLRDLPGDLNDFKRWANYVMEHLPGTQADFANKFDRLKQFPSLPL